jgi:hypothetical protein
MALGFKSAEDHWVRGTAEAINTLTMSAAFACSFVNSLKPKLV